MTSSGRIIPYGHPSIRVPWHDTGRQRGTGPDEDSDGRLIVTVDATGTISSAEIEQLVDEVFLGDWS